MIVTIGEKNLVSRGQFTKVCLLRLPCQSFKNKEYVLVVFHIRCNNFWCLFKTPLAHKQRGIIYISLTPPPPHSSNGQKLDSFDPDPSQAVRGEFFASQGVIILFWWQKGLLFSFGSLIVRSLTTIIVCQGKQFKIFLLKTSCWLEKVQCEQLICSLNSV